ncbi:hypothetical protein CFF98v445_01690 [Campylobacter fetus subsp. fetus]|nr:hypothetical protein CFV354_0154 [Campylobacter fetus subsp. venerealis NCTC 10354]OCS17068.1 hypothetical protein CfvWBT01109_00310 [Campylobacter fetus subsp. venerealis]OCS17610.1 hypothetical protein CFF98v445_01690 [Campylobacter fetus subsp. fetus]OCS20914.1 hypothetical protein CFVI03596_02830 [Campylobacter fetus subsp. venerealis cfvi03/596]OCS22514.1 hypothetical protein CFVI97532_04360 [Campylobacter fetus subsp. venerealis cfvi97/532]OCS24940.1 hypothetical protein CFVI9825_0031
MHGETLRKKSQMKWLDDFKSALVNEDLNKIEYLINNYPNKMDIEEMQCAAALLENAAAIYKRKQKELDVEFQKVKKARKYSF